MTVSDSFRAVVIILTLTAVACCAGCIRVWPKADEFARELKCGQTRGEVNALLRTYEVPVTIGATRQSVRIEHENVGFWVEFQKDKLVTVQPFEYVGMTGINFEMARNLCSGEEMVRVQASPEAYRDRRPTLIVDGRIIQRQADAPVDFLVTPGRHQFRLELDNGTSVERNIDVPRRGWFEFEF